MPISPQQFIIKIGSFVENRRKIKYEKESSKLKSKFNDRKMPKLLFRIILILMLVVGSTLGNMGTYNGDCCVPPPTSPSPQMCNSDPGQPTLRVLACSGCSSNYPNGSTPSPQVCNSDPVSLHCVCWHALDVPLTTPSPTGV